MGDFFCDDVADAPRLEDLRFPEGVYRAIQTCYSCPVRPQCLAWAYERESQVSDPSWFAESRTKEDGRRYGVWGGVPGRVREHFDGFSDRLARGERWVQHLAASRHWVRKEAV